MILRVVYHFDGLGHNRARHVLPWHPGPDEHACISPMVEAVGAAY